MAFLDRGATRRAHYLGTFVFGVEDSLVSTVGLLSGIAIAGVSQRTILVSGIILVLVEAFSMAVGSFLAEHSEEDYLNKREMPLGNSVADGAIMFFSYFASGFIPLFPYAVFAEALAFRVSVAMSLFALFFLGAVGARLSHTGIVRNGFRMAAIGGVAIMVGVLVGIITRGIL